MKTNGVKTLLMGGQACVFYGAAEFSRDLDLLILTDETNLTHLRRAFADLEAEPIAVPALDARYLQNGHAVHFRCHRADVAGLRIDVMSSLRGVDAFEKLWERRTVLESDGETIDVLSLPDLVQAKKTQRDKDWPMIRRLVEVSYFEYREAASAAQIDFLLHELRTTELLIRSVAAYPTQAASIALQRKAIQAALEGDSEQVELALQGEEFEERRRDRLYWEPLKRELEQLRAARRRPG